MKTELKPQGWSGFDYIASVSKPVNVSGDKEVPAGAEFAVINDGMTATLDSLFSPDEVDSFDASCNTCKSFQRRGMTPLEKSERNLYGMPGRCLKKDVDVRGFQRGQFCAFENAGCYENRRTGMTQILSQSEKAALLLIFKTAWNADRGRDNLALTLAYADTVRVLGITADELKEMEK